MRGEESRSRGEWERFEQRGVGEVSKGEWER